MLHLNTAVSCRSGSKRTQRTGCGRGCRRAAWCQTGPAGSLGGPDGSLLLGMAGQVAYHLLAQNRVTHAPWGVTTAVSCLPVLVLGMGAALAHMLRSDAHLLSQHGRGASTTRTSSYGAAPDRSADTVPRHRMAEADAVAQRLIAAGRGCLGAASAEPGCMVPTPIWESWRAWSNHNHCTHHGQASQRQTANRVIMPLTGL